MKLFKNKFFLYHRGELCQSWSRSAGTLAKFKSPRETLPKLVQVSRSFGKVWITAWNFAKVGGSQSELRQSLNYRVKLCQSWCKSVGALAKFKSPRETLPKLVEVCRSFGKVWITAWNFAKVGASLSEHWQSLNHRVKLCQSWCKSLGALAKFESSRETLPKLMQVCRSFGKVWITAWNFAKVGRGLPELWQSL